MFKTLRILWLIIRMAFDKKLRNQATYENLSEDEYEKYIGIGS